MSVSDDLNPDFSRCVANNRFNAELANILYNRYELALAKESLSKIEGSGYINHPYGAVYRPNTAIRGELLEILEYLWQMREKKDFELVDTIKRVLGGKFLIHRDRLEWIALYE